MTALAQALRDLTGAEPEQLRLGIAVSGGPDSMALLHLAAKLPLAAVEAATVDHGLRFEAAAEAVLVAGYCADRGIRHATLHPDRPLAGSVQAAAREARYALLEAWRTERGLDYILTAHHADDQAETLVMRLNRGSGVAGLAGIRARNGRVLRPLLDWRRSTLAGIVAAAGIPCADDPSNRDARFDRSRIRSALAGSPLLDVPATARSAELLAQANAALDWAAQAQIESWPDHRDPAIIRDGNWPDEIGWRILRLRIQVMDPGAGADQKQLLGALAALRAGQKVSLGELLLIPDRQHRAIWRISPAPPRRSH